MQPDLAATFRIEAGELLSDLEEALLELEARPEDGSLIARAFRDLHTIKGSGGMAGFGELVRFAHAVESVFDRVRNGVLPVNRDLLTQALQAKDHIHRLIGAGPGGGAELSEETEALLALFLPYLGQPVIEKSPGEKKGRAASGPTECFWVRFRPPQDALISGMRPLSLLEEMSALGELRAAFHHEEIPSLEAFSPDCTYGWWDIFLQTSQGVDGIQDVFIFVEGAETLHIQPLGMGQIRADDLTRFLETVRGQSVLEKAREALLAMCEAVRQERTKRRSGEVSSSAESNATLRVDAQRLDKLVDMVGELVIIQSRLSMAVRRVNDAGLSQIAEELERLSDTMRGNALGLRMIPIGISFNSFKRLVRDLGVQLGKNADFVAEGAETELDKTVIDRLKDPLLHILRNAVDHGLESPEERLRANKPVQGTVRMTASNAGGDVVITIRDDGHGIDAERVRIKAVAKGMLAEEANPSRKELYALLFEPGFSTADKVSDVSGRGVGMDVVKKGIEALRGVVEIDSAPGVGTVFTIRLPLTLAIIDGLAVKVGQESFIIPLATVEACQERRGDVTALVDTISRNEKLIPCISLRRLLNVPGEPAGFERILIARVDDMEVGMAVDRVLGRQQAVIKSLGSVYRESDWISGTTINGDGGISLILDVAQIVRAAYARSQGAVTRLAS